MFILFGFSCFANVELATALLVLVKSKAGKQEVSHTVIPMVRFLCLMYLTCDGQLESFVFISIVVLGLAGPEPGVLALVNSVEV